MGQDTIGTAGRTPRGPGRRPWLRILGTLSPRRRLPLPLLSFLPPLALWSGITTPPARRDEPWVHQALWHSITIIFWGCVVSSAVGVPLGIVCGALPAAAHTIPR